MREVENHKPIQRLVNRYDLAEDRTGQPVHMSTVIQPVTQVDELVGVMHIVTLSLDLSAAAGNMVALVTVGDQTKFKVCWMWMESTVAASALALRSVRDGAQIAVSATDANAKSQPMHGVPLESGDIAGALSTGNAGDNSVSVSIMYITEDV